MVTQCGWGWGQLTGSSISPKNVRAFPCAEQSEQSGMQNSVLAQKTKMTHTLSATRNKHHTLSADGVKEHLPKLVQCIHFNPTPDVKIYNRLLQTLSGWHAAGLGLPLMIIWLLHNGALQLSRAQTLKWQQPPPPPPPAAAAALISSWAPRAAGLPACCAIWHTEPLTPSLCKSRDADWLQHTFSE